MILLDTHVVVWLALDPSKISKKAAGLISGARKAHQEISISDVTLYELASLNTKRRIHLKVPLLSFLQEVERRFVIKPITSSIAAKANEFEHPFPGDPMDRIIGATALVEGLILVTADKMIQKSKAVPTIW
jgi:PIN domain nuclease of toxin-antitoxin system